MYIRLFFLIAFFLSPFLCTGSLAQASVITITEEMVTDESGSGDFMAWFDEQDLSKTPVTRWVTSGNVNCWPAGLVVDLKRMYRIEAVYVFDAPKSYRVEGGYLKIEGGRPFEWRDSTTQALRNKGRWVKIACPMETRYLRLQKNATVMCNLDGKYPENCDLAINEILIEGEPIGEVEPVVKPAGKRPEPCPMDLFIGMNSYINTPDKAHEAVGCVREYRPWGWNGVTDLQTPISWATLRDGNSDDYYRKLKDMGIDCVPCIHRHVDAKNQSERIPHFGGDPVKPETYSLMADYSYQYAARYGSRKVPDRLLRTTEAAPKKSGLGLIRYFENWNEGNREWGDPEEHFNPYVFSAFCSASYDGHLGTMGEGFGVKQADPEMKYVFGGLVGLSLSYIQAMKLWSDHYRNGSFPADVINVHHYCNTRGKQHPKETAYGISPEEDGLKERLEKLVKWRNANLPDKEIWLTEFGWDTDSATYQSAAKGHKRYPDGITMNEIQGQWLVRAFLAGSAAGLDRMMMFLANDIKGYTLGVYGSCGFFTVDGEYKPSWYYVKTMKTALAGMVFDGECTSAATDVRIYRYKDRTTGKLAYALWCPTSDGTRHDRYRLRLDYSSAKDALLISLADQKDTGEKQTLSVVAGEVEVDVSERPVFLVVDRPEEDAPRVKVDTTGDFITYLSPYYALSWVKDFPMMSYFNVESGGRNRRYQDKSLLRPGKGGCLVAGEESSFGMTAPAVCDGWQIAYEDVPFKEGGHMDCVVSPDGDRRFSVSVRSLSDGIEGEFFRIHTAPDISPVSVWAAKTTQEPSARYDTPVTAFSPKIIKASFRLPAVLHFPDCGLVRVEADSPEVYLQEHFVPDYENTGLLLGPFNRGGHVWRKSVHMGSVVLSFHAEKPLKETGLTFTVLEENYPQIPGCDFSDARFDGLKRCWQNAFTVNPVHQTMGDNILLEGIGHLALAFKADMIPFTPELSGTYSMREALRTSIEVALRERIGPNNRLKDYGWESTEVTLISLYDYLLATNDWAFVCRYKNEISRLVRGVLALDTDADGIFESPFHGNYMDPKRESLNWWDDFAFGHKDAYHNLQAYRALTGMQKVLTLLALPEEAAAVGTAVGKFRSAFDATFFNPTTGMYAGWVSRDGRMHDYQFTFISSMAINEGLVPEKRARKILRKMLAKLKEEGYDYVYGIPGPLVSVADADKGSWEEMTRWGRYENGGLCGQAAYHFIQALYNVGMRSDADEILFTMMATYEREYTHSGVFPGYLQSVDWRTKGGAPTGYNYLADNYYFLLAAVTGHYGIKYPELQAPSTDPAYAAALYGDRLFDTGWKFSEDAPAEASDIAFDDSAWRTLTLPHDFSIERCPSPFVKGLKDSISTGHLPGGTGWYRKRFTLDEWTARQQVRICFDGVMERSDVWINGRHLGFHPNGYMPFSYDLTPYLRPAGQENVIAVRAFNPGDNSRWYPGSGIYRHVRLAVSGRVFVPDEEIQVSTPQITPARAKVEVAFPVQNKNDVEVDVTVQLTLVDPEGRVAGTKEYPGKVAASGSKEFRLTAEVEQPELWSVDSPTLYEAHIRVLSGGKTTDFHQTTFGIRSLDFSVDKGFLLNGVPVKLKGACLHHDNGLLGAAAFDEAEMRKVRLLKENGFNAIRTSHNPPSSQFLDACDRLGMLVIDEAFDMWEHPKRDQDYHLFFREHAAKDLASLVKRDRNHPSVILWSIGNEIYERADTAGLRIAAELVSTVKSLDTSRPVTQGICDFWEQKGRTWDESAPAYTLLDVGGYNYEVKRYLIDHQAHPSRIMVGTESFPIEALENWEAACRYPFVLGDFVWTGMDYIGEVGIGNFSYTHDDRPYSTPTRSWPWYLSNCGDLDICGGKKPQSLFRDVVWGRSDLELLVHAPVPEGHREVISKWGWPDEHPHWNWPGHEGKRLNVRAYSRCDSVRLYLDGKLLEAKAVSGKLSADFDVPYSAGCLMAVGVKDGREVARKSLQTTGRPRRIVLSPEKTTVSADPNDLAYVEVRVVDEAGRLVPDVPVRLKMTVDGEGHLLASGNAAPDDMESFRNSACTTYRGSCQAILQPGTESGTMRLKVVAEGLPAVETVINVASVKYRSGGILR